MDKIIKGLSALFQSLSSFQILVFEIYDRKQYCSNVSTLYFEKRDAANHVTGLYIMMKIFQRFKITFYLSEVSGICVHGFMFGYRNTVNSG